MCRWIAYQGEPTFLDALVAEPAHSLIAQSLCAAEAKVVTNGDGFGIGWYGDRDRPGVYREVRPAWSDENLRSLCHQVRSPLFFAHVRASTGPAIARANCHPFTVGRLMFMHNGQIGQFCAIKRRVEAMIPDDLYHHRSGTTDSEALFLAAFAHGVERDPIGGIAATLAAVDGLMRKAGLREALRFTACLTDGTDLYAFRWASDNRAPTLYFRQTGGNLVVVSEPLDGDRKMWSEVPQGCVLVARRGQPAVLRGLDEAISGRAAARAA
ncbi:MAG: class II glutamine amidotransferase [Caulobacteraceae bacterium]|nr:class II glutamine amidotransferase [Caulobacter sp.]